ncbi:unnamed protein product, partial [Ectocarpus sp. 8 AP-2014]
SHVDFLLGLLSCNGSRSTYKRKGCLGASDCNQREYERRGKGKSFRFKGKNKSGRPHHADSREISRVHTC